MLKAVMKALAGEPSADMEQVAPAAEMNNDLSDMSLAEQLNVALGELTASNEKLAIMANEIEGYKQKLESLQSYADEAEAKALAAAEEMKAKDIADKKQMLADVIGGDNPGFETTFAAIANLEGEAFNVVVNGFKAAFEKEAESPFFKEMGVSGDAEPVKDKEESATARIIKQQYNK